jgi:2-aminoadipate transaminase
MVAALRRELPEVSFVVPRGGYYLWLALPAPIDGDELARRAQDAGVSILAGSRCFARGDAGEAKRHVRLAFSHATPEEIDEGVRRLATAYRSLAAGAAVPTTAPR